MLRLLAKRIITSVLAVIGATILVFFLARLSGNPAYLYLPVGATPEQIAQFEKQAGLDKPILVQLFDFVSAAVRFDFGESLREQRPAMDVALGALPQTIALVAVAMILATLTAVALGALAAVFRYGKLDNVITTLSIGAASIPTFWFALLGILIFAVQLHLIPTSGQSGFSSWILPVLTLMLEPVGLLTQVTRGAMIEALTSGYIEHGRALGYSGLRLSFKHALRNAGLPVIAVATDQAAGMVNGAIIVSAVFAWPGIGSTTLAAVQGHDYAVIQACVFVVAIAIVVLNLAADAAYAWVDPRVRLA